MNICAPIAIPFKNNEPLNEVAKEFNIKFYSQKSNFEKLIDFIQKYEDKRINIEFPDELDLSVVRAINKIADNVYIRLFPQDLIHIKTLQEYNCKFFPDSTIAANNYSVLESYISLGVSDVYIADDLCYNLSEVSKFCSKHNTNIRMILNRIPSTCFDKGENFKSPIFRPQDYHLLKLYINTFEFDCLEGGEFNWNKQKVLYRVWFEEQKWVGDLREINRDLKFYFPNASIVPDFTNYKINCEKHCISKSKNKCSKCVQLIELGILLDSKNVRIKKEDTNAKN